MPRGKAWDAQLLVEALQERGVKATRVGDCVMMTLPIVRIEIDRIVNAKTIDDLRPEIVGFTSASISFVPTALLGNIVFEYGRTFDADSCPRVADVTKAIVDCGYDTGSDRDLANKYYTGQIDLNPIFDRIAELQSDKENAVAECRFDDASAIHKKQLPLKERIMDLLREFI